MQIVNFDSYCPIMILWFSFIPPRSVYFLSAICDLFHLHQKQSHGWKPLIHVEKICSVPLAVGKSQTILVSGYSKN